VTGPAHPAFPASSPVGRSFPRAEASRLAAGRGRYTDDLVLPRMVHVAFVRSPHAHARIRRMETAEAQAMPGVVRIVTGHDIEAVCRPMQTSLAHLPQHKSAPQLPIATSEVAWQGEPVVAVVARNRAEAEDAAQRIEIDWEELPAVADPAAALAEGAAAVHSALESNLALTMRIQNGDVDAAFRSAAAVIEHTFDFGRLCGVSLEPRATVADYDPVDRTLTVHQSHQSPHLMQTLYAQQLDIPEHKVRVIAGDVGGAFGNKLHMYGDDLATAAIARLLGRPVKFTADRLEAFQTDSQARECRVRARLAAAADGRVLGIDAEVLSGIGSYSIYPRSSLGDGVQAASFLCAPYEIGALRSLLRVAYQNKVPSGAFRGIGQPLACAVTEQLMDFAADALGLDPAEMRRRNHLAAERPSGPTKGGLRIGPLSLGPCLDRVLARMDYAKLRGEQAALRAKGVYRGIGLATFVEQTAPGAALYGPSGIPVTSQDTCTVRLEPSGTVRCQVGCTDQGQGTLTGIAQIVAAALGVAFDDVAVSAGDSAGPPGGGAWASRGLTISGEAAFTASRELRHNVLTLAATILQTSPAALDIRDGVIVDAADGRERMTLAKLCQTAQFRQDLLPQGAGLDLSATSSFVPRHEPYFVANGIQACHLEVDIETGWIRLLGHWVVEDCGYVVNPDLVDGQIRGGVVQGLGAALFEESIYDERGQQMTATLADYLVPMAADMPDIDIDHVTTPQAGTSLQIKGVGEAGTVGASAAVWCAINDALRPLGARLTRQPFTPERVLTALREARERATR
jgi:aerobic carbon-monoxide dehydrogenase large subunit